MPFGEVAVLDIYSFDLLFILHDKGVFLLVDEAYGIIESIYVQKGLRPLSIIEKDCTYAEVRHNVLERANIEIGVGLS